MEGTATNMEEEGLPGRQRQRAPSSSSGVRLPGPPARSTAAAPAAPRTAPGSSGGILQEKVAARRSGHRARDLERADAAFPGVSPDDYSLQAVQKEVAERGLPFADAFVRFGATNRLLNYADAKAGRLPDYAERRLLAPGTSRPTTTWRYWRIDHLATRFFSFAPGSSVKPDARLRLRLTLPRSGARAAVIVVNATARGRRDTLKPNPARQRHPAGTLRPRRCRPGPPRALEREHRNELLDAVGPTRPRTPASALPRATAFASASKPSSSRSRVPVRPADSTGPERREGRLSRPNRLRAGIWSQRA